MPYVGSNITPQRRALDLPGEFVVKDNQLFCKWCEKVFTSLRMDNLRLHLTSSLHKENKLKLGGPITINNSKITVLKHESNKFWSIFLEKVFSKCKFGYFHEI